MVSRLHLRAAVLAVGVALLAGCKSPTPLSQPATAPRSGEMPRAASRKKDEALSVEKIAQAHAHYATGVLLELNEQTDAALEEFAQAALADPPNEALALDVSRHFLQRNRPEKAVRVLTNTTARADASGKIYTQLGVAYVQLGQKDLAANAYRTAIKKSPRSWTAYENLFALLSQNRQPAEAGKVLDQALKQLDGSADFLVELAELYTAFGRQVPARKEAARVGALAALNRAVKLNPASPHLRLKMADGFTTLGETAKAVPVYTNLIEFYREFPMLRDGVRAKLADIFLRSNDRARATEQLEAIVRDEPTNPLGYYYLGSIAYDQKKTAQAAEYFAKAVLVGPDFERAYYDLARAQIVLNQTQEALATLEKARAKFRDNFAAAFLTGMAYARQKDYPEAISHYTAAEVLAKASDPKRTNEVLYFQLGSAYERKGDIEQAEKYFQQALKVSPDFAEALNYLGYMWAERGENLDRARVLIERALKLEPKNAAYLDSMGWVLFKLNRPQAALEYLRKAVACAEEPDATLFDHLGDIYAALHQNDKAAEAWRKSLAIESSESVRKKLDRLSPK